MVLWQEPIPLLKTEPLLLGCMLMHVQILISSNFNCAGSYTASTGTVVISGSGTNTTVEVNLQDSADGANITASYTGGFTVIN